MAKLVYAPNMSLDGFVDHMAFAPDPELFRHFIDDVPRRGATPEPPAHHRSGMDTRVCASASLLLRPSMTKRKWAPPIAGVGE